MVSERKGEGDGMLTLLHGDCKGPHLEYFVAVKKVEQVAAEKDFLHIINSFNNPQKSFYNHRNTILTSTRGHMTRKTSVL